MLFNYSSDNYCWLKCRNTKKEWLLLKGKVSIKRRSFPHASTKNSKLHLKGLVSSMGNDFHEKERFRKKKLKGMASTKMNGSNKGNSIY